jgi:hypothetical protein
MQGAKGTAVSAQRYPLHAEIPNLSLITGRKSDIGRPERLRLFCRQQARQLTHAEGIASARHEDTVAGLQQLLGGGRRDAPIELILISTTVPTLIFLDVATSCNKFIFAEKCLLSI